MPYITRDQAREAAIRHLLKESRKLKVVDESEVPEGYYKASSDSCWGIYIPSHQNMVGPSRWILVSKTSGKVIFDGLLGE